MKKMKHLRCLYDDSTAEKKLVLKKFSSRASIDTIDNATIVTEEFSFLSRIHTCFSQQFDSFSVNCNVSCDIELRFNKVIRLYCLIVNELFSFERSNEQKERTSRKKDYCNQAIVSSQRLVKL